MKFLLLTRKKLPQGNELEGLAEQLGVSQFNIWVTKDDKTGLDEAELQRRVLDCLRARREEALWLIALIAAAASFLSALAAWVAVTKVS